MTDLPVLKGLEPIATCGVCNRPLYPYGKCQGDFAHPSCPLKGNEWSRLVIEYGNDIYNQEPEPKWVRDYEKKLRSDEGPGGASN
jgi:hypothetical protein